MGRKDETIRSIALNKKAGHLYHIIDRLECGISLLGTEVKSLRAGRITLVDAYGSIKRGELWLMKANIAEYSHGNINNHDPLRPRKLLAHRHEIERLGRKVREKGMTLVPTQIYFQGHLVKVELALVQGKKLHDKRQVEKERSAKRDMDRALGRRRYSGFIGPRTPPREPPPEAYGGCLRRPELRLQPAPARPSVCRKARSRSITTVRRVRQTKRPGRWSWD